MRTIYNLNDNWSFIKDYKEEYLNQDANLDAFKVVTVPHTYNDVDGACGFEFYRGKTVYRRNVELTAAMVDNRLYLEFEGVSLESDVYFNGTHLGHHAGGFSTFRYEVTELANEGDNLVVVVADNTYNDTVYPLMADFTFYGGVYRNVNLVEVNDVHFNLLDDGSKGVFVRQSSITDEAAQIQGGVGTAGSANLGDKYAMFEAIHGSAVRMIETGRGQYANPTSLFKAVEMMLRHIGYVEKANRLAKAMQICNEENKVVITGRSDGATCKEYSDYLMGIIEKL